jgi:hypothetical protein
MPRKSSAGRTWSKPNTHSRFYRIVSHRAAEAQRTWIANQNLRASARDSIRNSLKIARDCGFGIFHIDLVLTQARLHLLEGRPDEALADVRIALHDGIPADAAGQPELLAARAPECGYAWAIAEGVQLHAEALLLRTAQTIGSATAGTNDMPSPFVPREAPADGRVMEVPDQARGLLRNALDLWRPLHDPEPEREDQNFHLDGTPHNYHAAETYRILTELDQGLLTRYPLEPVPIPDQEPETTSDQAAATRKFDVFLSHNSKDKPGVRKLKNRLTDDYDLTVWFDEDELPPGVPWQALLEEGIVNSGSIAVLVGADGIAPWEDEEMQAALQLGVRDGRPVIPVLLPGASAQLKLPMFIGNRTWVDLRDGLKKAGLDKLVWGITGVKP